METVVVSPFHGINPPSLLGGGGGPCFITGEQSHTLISDTACRRHLPSDLYTSFSRSAEVRQMLGSGVTPVMMSSEE